MHAVVIRGYPYCPGGASLGMHPRATVMRCPNCHSSDTTVVINTVHRLDGSIRRRHGCWHCQLRWTGEELISPGSMKQDAVPRRSRKP